MRNIEKYKNNLQNGILICDLYREIYKIKNGEYPYDWLQISTDRRWIDV